MSEWQENPRTIPPKETQLEPLSHVNNANTAAKIVATVTLQIGEVLTLISCLVSLRDYLEVVRQSNLATPVMGEATSYALLAMANLLMSTSDRLKTSLFTLPESLRTTQKVGMLIDSLHMIDEIIYECVDGVDPQ